MTARLAELVCEQAGHRLFDSLDEHEKAMLRFGMLPAGKTLHLQRELYARTNVLETLTKADVSRLIAVGAMEACNASGKPMVV